MTLLHQYGGGFGRSLCSVASLASHHHHSLLRLSSWSPEFVAASRQAVQVVSGGGGGGGVSDVSGDRDRSHQKQRELHGSGGRRSSAAKVLPKQLHDGQEVFLCPVCDQNGHQVLVRTKFELTTHLRTHNRAHEAAGQHRCAICCKELSSQSSLDRHMLTHSDERPFACPLCPTAFTTNGNMRRHMQTHRADPTLARDVERHLNGGQGRRRGRRPAEAIAAATTASPTEAEVVVVELKPQPTLPASSASRQWLARALKRRSVRLLRRQTTSGKQRHEQRLSTPLALTAMPPRALSPPAEDQPLDLSVSKAAAAAAASATAAAPLTLVQQPEHPWATAAAAAAAAAAVSCLPPLPWPWSLHRLAAMATTGSSQLSPPLGLWLPGPVPALHFRHPSPPASPVMSTPPPTPAPQPALTATPASDDADGNSNSDDTLGDLSDAGGGGDSSGEPEEARLARRKSRKNSYKEAPNLIYCPFDTCRQAFPWMSSLKRHIITHTSHKPYACTRCEHAFSTKSNRERHMERIHHVRVKGRQGLANLAPHELKAFQEHDRLAEAIGDRLLGEMGDALVTSANPHRGGGGGGGGGGSAKSDHEVLALSDSSSSR